MCVFVSCAAEGPLPGRYPNITNSPYIPAYAVLLELLNPTWRLANSCSTLV